MGRGEKKLLGVGLGAGLLGAIVVALKYAVRPATKSRVPDTISPEVFRTKVLHTSLGQIVYHECGSGPSLVFVHSICPGASSYEWSKVYPAFTTTHRVIAPDLIGFGESARPQAHLGAEDYARALAEFLRATCDEPVVLIGSGLGGGLCVLVASQHPELVGRLLLLMPTGLTEFGQRQLTLGTKLAAALPLLNQFLYRNYQSTRAAVRLWLTTFGFADATKVTDEIVDVYTTCAQQYGAEHAIANLHAGRLSFDFEARARMLTQPVTLLWSEAAAAFPIEWAQRLRETMRHGSVRTLPPSGPLAALECPEPMKAALREELQTELRVV